MIAQGQAKDKENAKRAARLVGVGVAVWIGVVGFVMLLGKLSQPSEPLLVQPSAQTEVQE